MRRVAALVLPLLACEVVRQRAPAPITGPLAVIALPEHAAEFDATATLDLVDDEARRYGIRPGMKVTEACALVAGLSVQRVTFAEVLAALGRVAELASSLAPITSICLESERSSADTIWLDVTGAAHLVGGEEALVDELVQRAASLGHRGRAAIADGPRIAEAIARFAPAHAARSVIAPGDGARALADLPIAALPLASEAVSWFLRLGLVTAGDLARLPRAGLASRLSGRSKAAEPAAIAPLVLDLLAGRDATPLVPFEAPRMLSESAGFDDGIEYTEGLLFVLRGMASRVSARLSARGEACSRLEVDLVLDRSIAELRAAAAALSPAKSTPRNDAPNARPALTLVKPNEDSASAKREDRGAAKQATNPVKVAPIEADARTRFEVHLAIDLPAPLVAEADLMRALRARLERLELAAPVVSMRLLIPAIARARRIQLDLSRGSAVNPDALPTLLAELSAEIGANRLGVLASIDAHAPERESTLAAPDLGRDVAYVAPTAHHPFARVTRLLPEPIPLGEFGLSRVVAVDQALMAVSARRFVLRLDEIGWWTQTPISRDYLTAVFAAPPLVGEALVYVDRLKDKGFLQGWLE
jgi:protein ImuB